MKTVCIYRNPIFFFFSIISISIIFQFSLSFNFQPNNLKFEWISFKIKILYKEKEYYQIPPEYLKYLMQSFQEFDVINRNYVEWYKLIYYKFSKEGKKLDSTNSVYYQSEVPKIDIKWIFDKEEDEKIGN